MSLSQQQFGQGVGALGGGGCGKWVSLLTNPLLKVLLMLVLTMHAGSILFHQAGLQAEGLTNKLSLMVLQYYFSTSCQHTQSSVNSLNHGP